MAGRQVDVMDYSEAEGNGSDERRESDWEEVGRMHRDKKEASRKRKKKGCVSSNGTESEEDEGKEPKIRLLNVVVRFEGEGGVKKMDPLKLTKIIREKVGEVKYARILGDGNLLVGCNNEVQMEKAKKMSCVGKIKIVRVGEKRSGGSKGVIYGIPLTVNMKELVENLRMKNRSVKSAVRMTRGVEKVETESVLVEFETKEVPKEVYYGFMRYSIRDYVPKPMRCYKCQEFGHMANVCKGKRRCARCSGDHEYGKCGEEVRPKCCNCGGNHSVAFWGCEVMKKEVKVQQIKLKENISYVEAVKRTEQEKTNQSGESGRSPRKEGKKWEEKKKIVTFIAGVINATAEVRSKTERIQIIVKAAIHHLDMAGLKWEEVRDELSVQSSQETTCIG
ncbi:uncharacterized protein LOC123975742 [Micropterus dolomieu]|uniref:uncharacterized protein LOC123975742 n=1 Tax=Micropterus dolomieu TaxID=147949 RepID=UPI001E8D8168|nr:uncharacterized protein LOC123975742 [Micropterus dolomieu]